ncbi:MAG TPA: MFS transporter [Casimicrobiaceae bacterium]|nr:MFS transporter [Casimicrobiaceae bacterium]
MALPYIAYDPVADRPAPRRYAWSVFAILFALMVVDYVDRQVVVSMFPHLKAYWDLSDSQLGGLVSIVSITVALGAVPLSLLADRWSRVKSIFLMVLIWSLACISCAFATSYWQLLGARGVVGMGEAAYGTVGAALLATLFPLRMRSTVLGGFFAAATMGSVLGVMLGGFIAERWGWQAGFGAVGVPGLLLCFVFLLIVRDYKTVALPSRMQPGHKPKTATRTRGRGRLRKLITALSPVIAELRRPRTALLACIGAGFNLLVVSTTWAWLPSFFNRYYGLAPDQAGVKTALVVLAGGVGTLLWSVVADRLMSRLPRARLQVPAVTAILTAVFMITAFAILPPGNAQFALIIAGSLMMTGSVGTVDAVVIDVMHPSVRATAASILSLMRNLFGLAAGPLLAGALSDAYGLPFAMSVIPLVCFVAAALYMLAARSYESDLKNVDTVTPARAGGLEPQAA